MKINRRISNGWNERFIILKNRILIGWAIPVKGDPWRGPKISIRINHNPKFFRIGVWPCVFAIGVASKYAQELANDNA